MDESWGAGHEAGDRSRAAGAGGNGLSLSPPVFHLVIGAQLVFLTSPQVPREGGLVMNTQRRGAVRVGRRLWRKQNGMPPAVERGTGRRHFKRKLGRIFTPLMGMSIQLRASSGPGTVFCSFMCVNSFNPHNNTIFILTLQMGKLRLKEVKCPGSRSW